MSTLRPPADLHVAEPSSAALAAGRVAVHTSPAVGRAEQRAWLIIWLAFATCCALVLSGLKLAADYVSSAEIDFTARAEDVGGQVYAQSPGGPQVRLNTSQRDLPAGTAIEATRGSNAVVQLFDGSLVTVQSEAKLALVRMEVGRFISRRTLLLRQTAGPVRYETDGEVTVQVPGGQVRLGRGDTTIWVRDDAARVLSYAGDARLEVEGQPPITLRAGQRADVRTDGRIEGPVARAVALLPNGDFARQAAGWDPIDVVDGPRDVAGERSFVEGPPSEGAPGVALRVLRNSQTLAHGETGLGQKLDLDVSGFRALYVEALVRVDSASLSGGGQLGSEYPMMLRVEYEGMKEGSRPNWAVGFYYANPEDRPVRGAEQVPQYAWVPYRVNLMDQPEDRRPYRLTSFDVLGQGHSYDARIAAVRLIGD